MRYKKWFKNIKKWFKNSDNPFELDISLDQLLKSNDEVIAPRDNDSDFLNDEEMQEELDAQYREIISKESREEREDKWPNINIH